jgi:hypothetical protein
MRLSVAHVTPVTHGLRSERGNEDFPAPTHVHDDAVNELATQLDRA